MGIRGGPLSFVGAHGYLWINDHFWKFGMRTPIWHPQTAGLLVFLARSEAWPVRGRDLVVNTLLDLQ